MIALSVLPWLAPLAIWGFLILVTRGPGGFADELTTRGPSWGTIVILAALLTATGFALARELFREHENEDARRTYLFALTVVGLGLLLILGPELYWLKDVFHFRVNTVFKLYYQAWTLLSIGGAVGLYYLTAHWRPRRPAISLARLCWAGLTTVIIAAALVYTVAATFERTSGFTNAQRMDGYVHVQFHHPDEYEAIRWLNDNVRGTPVILEAVGDAYSDYARISSRTGLPTVIGWPGHERIWRGWDELPTDRQEDVARAYTTSSPREAREILKKYNVEYVYVGHLEKEAYGTAGLAKFGAFMEVAFRNETVTIYRMPREVQTVVSAP